MQYQIIKKYVGDVNMNWAKFNVAKFLERKINFEGKTQFFQVKIKIWKNTLRNLSPGFATDLKNNSKFIKNYKEIKKVQFLKFFLCVHNISTPLSYLIKCISKLTLFRITEHTEPKNELIKHSLRTWVKKRVYKFL